MTTLDQVLAIVPEELVIKTGDTCVVLYRMQLVLVELMRQRRSDKYIRGATGLSQERLLEVSRNTRRELGCEIWESIREAADRFGVPRYDI